MRIRRILALATASLVLATTTAAHAAGPPYTVAVGGSTTGTQAITFASSGAVQFSTRNNAGTVINMNCTSLSGSATVTKGAGVNPLWSITSTTWNGCRAPGGPVGLTQIGTWNLSGTGSNATSGTETIAGYIGNLTMGVVWSPPTSICSYTVTGQLNGSFNEATQTLNINETGYTGNATLSGVSGCLGQLQNGNAMNFVTSLVVSTGGAGAINLS